MVASTLLYHCIDTSNNHKCSLGKPCRNCQRRMPPPICQYEDISYAPKSDTPGYHAKKHETHHPGVREHAMASPLAQLILKQSNDREAFTSSAWAAPFLATPAILDFDDSGQTPPIPGTSLGKGNAVWLDLYHADEQAQTLGCGLLFLMKC